MSSNGKWTTENIPDQTGRIAIVTGANSGIGYETARPLAHKGASVIMACRDETKGNAAAKQILDERPSGTVEVMVLDLADLDSVKRFAQAFRERHDHLDLLINNAGVMMIPERQTTPQGSEMQFGTNHLGHFALTGLLIDTLLATPGSRVVNVSSMTHQFGSINLDDLQSKETYSPSGAYGQSKLANLLFTNELGRRFQALGSDSIAASSHPGWTATNLQQHSRMAQILNPIVAQSPPMGALPTLYAATAADVSNGDFYGPRGLMGMRGHPKKAQASDRSQDEAMAARLWTASEELTGIQYSQLDEAIAS